MNENTTLGVVAEFTAHPGVDIVFTPSRPSKAECLQIAWLFYEASGPEQEAMLADFGGVLVRRSLRVFANYAARTGQREVAEYANELRDSITVVRDDDTEAAS